MIVTERRPRFVISARISPTAVTVALARRPRALGRLVRRAAVVEDDDVAGLEAGQDAPRGFLGRLLPVVAHRGEPDLRPAEVTDRPAHALVAAQERGTPVARRKADHVLEHLAGEKQLLADLVVGERLQIGVGLRVVAEVVAPLGEPAQRTPARRVVDRLADREERAAAVMALERVGDRVGPLGGAVVEGQRNDWGRDAAAGFDRRRHVGDSSKGSREGQASG